MRSKIQIVKWSRFCSWSSAIVVDLFPLLLTQRLRGRSGSAYGYQYRPVRLSWIPTTSSCRHSEAEIEVVHISPNVVCVIWFSNIADDGRHENGLGPRRRSASPNIAASQGVTVAGHQYAASCTTSILSKGSRVLIGTQCNEHLCY